MAKMRGGSTVGGKQIVTVDMMNDVIYQIVNSEGQTSKMNLAEIEKITDFTKADSYIKDKSKNGFWQVENAINTTMNNNGLIANLSNTDARFQLYASNTSSEDSTLYFRTGWGNSIKNWRKVVTDTILEDGLSQKFNKTGGDISGSIEASNYISTSSFLRARKNNEYLKMSINSSNEAYYEASTNISKHNFNKAVNVNGNITVNNSNTVYHTGNFDYRTFAAKNAKAATSTNLNSMTTSGTYYGTFTSNSPITTSLSYVDVSTNDDGTNIIQRLYSTAGKAYYRVRNSGTWTSWFTMGGSLNFTKDITAGNWTSSNGMYELTVTHNLNSDKITSVVVTDSDNVSMFTAFKVLSTTSLKVYSATAVAGKVIINANQ